MRISLWVVCLVLSAAACAAWDGHGHRTITRLALEGLPADMPPWMKDESVWKRAEFQSSEPDRWRGAKVTYLSHINNADHYLDVEDLEAFGLTLRTAPRLRFQYVEALVLARAADPEVHEPIEDDADGVKGWPGFVMHAIAENHAKLRSSLRTLRILESLNDPSWADAIEMSRANVIACLGVLSHFVGDAAQPLHTTRHHHGWIGDNPHGYTTDRGIHAYIDGTILLIHSLDFQSLHPGMDYVKAPPLDDPWELIVAHVERSFAQVEPLYAMHRDGTLTGDPGKAMIKDRLCDGARTLHALIWSAWVLSEPAEEDAARFLRVER